MRFTCTVLRYMRDRFFGLREAQNVGDFPGVYVWTCPFCGTRTEEVPSLVYTYRHWCGGRIRIVLNNWVLTGLEDYLSDESNNKPS